MISSANLPPHVPHVEKTVALPAKVVVSLRAGVVLAIANIVCVVIFSWAWMKVRTEPKVIAVTGSAKRVIQSDLIVWNAEVSVSNADLGKGYAELQADTAKTLEFLKKAGIPPEQITVASVNVVKHFERDDNGNETDKLSSIELVQGFEVTSTNVKLVADVARKVTELLLERVLLDSHPPKYIYTKLADLKIAMLADATKDATIRAHQIAENSGAKLGSIREARMGVMQINAIHSASVSDYGNNDTTSLEKEITAVVSTKFSLE